MIKNYFKLFLAILFVTNVNGQSAWNTHDLPLDLKAADIQITNILVDSNNNKWVGSSNGLYKYDGSKWEVFNTTNSKIPSNVINKMIIDKKNNIWTVSNNIISKFDGKNWNTLNSSLGGGYGSTINISSIAIDNLGNIWVGSSNGLYNYNGTKWINYNTKNSKIISDWVGCIAIDSLDNKWLGVDYQTSGVLLKFDGLNWTTYDDTTSCLNCSYGPGVTNIRDITFGNNGKIYVARGNKLSLFDQNKWETLLNKGSYSVYVDYKGLIWVGTYDGIYNYSGVKWNIYTASNSPLKSYSNFITIDKNNKKWFINYSFKPNNKKLFSLVGNGNSELCNLEKNKININYSPKSCQSSAIISLNTTLNNKYSWFYTKDYYSQSIIIDSNKQFKANKNGFYSIFIQDSICYFKDSIFVELKDTVLNFKIPICMVANQNNLNLVVWGNIDNDYVSKYRIYKQNQTNSKYELVHEQSKHEISQWLDTLSNSNINSDRYKISILDSCGNETPLSNNHTTMLLSSNVGINGTVNLAWNPYEGFDYQNFEIWRSTDGTNFTKIGSVANNSYAYIDNNPPATAWYQIRISKQDACNPTKRVLTSVNSNIISKEGKSLGLKNMENNAISISPNPNTGKFSINNIQPQTNFSVLDINGRLIYQSLSDSDKIEIDVECIAKKGIYFLQATLQGNLVGSEKIVIE